jgi:pyruvate kinase
MMARIANKAEASNMRIDDAFRPAKPSHNEIVADAAWRAANAAGASAIVVFTQTGASARLVARYRPTVPIYAFTPSEAAARQLSVVYGVRPVLAPDVGTTDHMMAQMDEALTARGYVSRGESVVFVAGQPIGRAGTTNMMKLHRVGRQ